MTLGGRFEMLGWGLFFLSGVVFLAGALRAGDPWTTWGSVAWLAGVVFFLWDFRSRRR